jgi:hypothetical protein
MQLLYILLAGFGFVPFVITLFKMKRIQRMRKSGVKTKAVIKEIYSRSTRGINKMLIEFRLENGLLVSQEIFVGGMPYDEGDELPLIYDKNDPAKNILDPGKSYSIILLFTLLIGTFVLLAAYKIKKGIETGNFD